MLINQVYWKLGQLVLGVVSASPIEINAFAYGMTIPELLYYDFHRSSHDVPADHHQDCDRAGL